MTIRFPKSKVLHEAVVTSDHVRSTKTIGRKTVEIIERVSEPYIRLACGHSRRSIDYRGKTIPAEMECADCWMESDEGRAYRGKASVGPPP